MSNIVDINSRKTLEIDDFFGIPKSFCQNNKLCTVSIAVAVYIKSKHPYTISVDEIKKHFDFNDFSMEFIFENLREHGYLSINTAKNGTKKITLDLNGF